MKRSSREIAAGDPRWAPLAQQAPLLNLGLGAIHPAIPNNAHRVRECVIFLAEHPDSSNRELATGIGMTDQSQMSRLLASLARENLATKHSEGIGKRNSWQLTTHGEEIARALSEPMR